MYGQARCKSTWKAVTSTDQQEIAKSVTIRTKAATPGKDWIQMRQKTFRVRTKPTAAFSFQTPGGADFAKVRSARYLLFLARCSAKQTRDSCCLVFHFPAQLDVDTVYVEMARTGSKEPGAWLCLVVFDTVPQSFGAEAIWKPNCLVGSHHRRTAVLRVWPSHPRSREFDMPACSCKTVEQTTVHTKRV